MTDMLPSESKALLTRFMEPVDAASMAVFRILFGTLMGVGAVRVMTSGWVEILWGRPSFFFKYPAFEWLEPFSIPGMYALYTMTAVFAFAVALGFFYRIAILGFFLCFTTIQLFDVTNYLNHYYLVCLLALLMNFMPLHATWSLDAYLRPSRGRSSLPRWMLYLLRFQFCIVYFYAGMAKFGGDWLLHAQPMGIWMASRVETPIIGPWLREAWVVFAMSWAGFLYDLSIPLWLSMRRTRPYAFVLLLVFHSLTLVFFSIGLFPFIMSLGGLLFFDPDWPRACLARFFPSKSKLEAPISATWTAKRVAGASLIFGYLLFQALFPLRHFFHPGDVLWNEQGMRYSWKVMVREKNGSITFRCKERGKDSEWYVNPLKYLQWRQYKEMSGQPDLIVQLAKHVAKDYAKQGLDVEVRVDALVSLNGRRARPMIDPKRDLTRVSLTQWPADWLTGDAQRAPLTAGRMRR